MPVTLGAKICRLDQKAFGDIAYRVLRRAFLIHGELGRCFEEKIYRREPAFRLPGARTEVPIDLVFEDFAKRYFLDLLVEGGAIFELKAVESLTSRHRGQLLNYLLLSDAAHGKLINFRPHRVQHEFVNNTLTHSERVSFTVDDRHWQEVDSRRLKERMVSLLCDWGTALDLALYEEAASHFCGRHGVPCDDVEIVVGSRSLGVQPVRVATREIALRVTAWPDEHYRACEIHLRRFLAHSRLRAAQWINITPRHVQFTTLERKAA